MIKSEFTAHVEQFFNQCLDTMDQGQKEYTLTRDVFDNFSRVGSELGTDRKLVLWIYLRKHMDGILNHLKGHKLQRESVHGRVKDAVNYLVILDAMIAEEERLEEEF